jgi:hypothetical protein
LHDFSNKVQFAPPRHNELEISLFGPGIGECIVIHIGDNQWIIVDSCIDSSTKEPAPLGYLNQLGINPYENVKLFIITHWHSDHIRGASEIAKKCAGATICFSEALLKEEFLTIVACYSGLERPVVLDRENNGVREISSIIQTIKKRCEQRSNLFLPFNLASADKRIYRNDQREVWTLSPSSSAIVNSLVEIRKLIPTPSAEEIRRVIPIPTKNNNAIVLFIRFGELINVLLGSDLEETADPLTGWSAIVVSPNRPQRKSMLFKIPHHGSENAHSHKVWHEMVESEPIGILTTKIGGRSSLPKESDIRRLKKYTPNLFITLEPSTKLQKRDRVVEKTIKGVLKNRVPLDGTIGQIQVRIGPDSSIQVGLKDPATKL